MTTKQLIEKLKTFPKDQKVFIYVEELEDCVEVESIGESEMHNPILYLNRKDLK